MTSDWRGEKRITSEPKREMSKRLAPAAMSSMAQQARPIGMGQREFLRNQLSAASRRVTMTSPSIFESKPISVRACIKGWSDEWIARPHEPKRHKKGRQVEFVIFFTKSGPGSNQ